MTKLHFLNRLRDNLLLGLGGVVFALMIGEIGLRILGISYPSFYQVDRDRGHALIPGISGWWRHEGKGYVQVNQDGLRDQNHEKIKPANTFRIAVLGDSFAEAIQVNVEETFWSAIAQNLKQCPALEGRKIEVINFGVGDYGTTQEWQTLNHHVWGYSPDLVLLAIFTGNDLVNNSKKLSPSDRFTPFLVKENNKFVLDNSFNQTATYRWRDSLPRKAIFSIVNHSYLIQVLNQARIAFKKQKDVGNNPAKAQPSLAEKLDFDPNLYRDPQDQNWQETWAATDELLRIMHLEVKDKGAQFLAVTLSNPPQVYPDRNVREKLAKQLGVPDLFYPDRHFKKLGDREGFSVLNLAPLFQTYADEKKVFLHGFENTALGIGHWNQQGHQLAGKLMANKLCMDLKK
jgi:hypothetical protein